MPKLTLKSYNFYEVSGYGRDIILLTGKAGWEGKRVFGLSLSQN